MQGRGGNDLGVNASGIPDTQIGGRGRDRMNGQSGQDRLVESGDRDFYLTDDSLKNDDNAPTETDVLANIERAMLTGGVGDNLLYADDSTSLAFIRSSRAPRRCR